MEDSSQETSTPTRIHTKETDEASAKQGLDTSPDTSTRESSAAPGPKLIKLSSVVIGLIAGASLTVSFLKLSTDDFAQITAPTANVIFYCLMALVTVAFIVYLRGDYILRALFNGVSGTADQLVEALTTALRALPDRDRSAEALVRAGREGLALITKVLAWRSFITVVIGMTGVVVTLVGTNLLVLQTKALEIQNSLLGEQNEKLERQTDLLNRQVAIAADEGQWEALWKVHYSSDPATKTEAAVELAKKGHKLYGLVLDGGISRPDLFNGIVTSPTYSSSWDGPKPPRYIPVPSHTPVRDKAGIFEHSLRRLPGELMGHLAQARIQNFLVNLTDSEVSILSGTSFERSAVSLGKGSKGKFTCDHCTFDRSRASTVYDGKIDYKFSNSRFINSHIRSHADGATVFSSCWIDASVLSLAWGRDGVQHSAGRRVVLDYSFPREADKPGKKSGIQHSSFETIVIIWKKEKMKDVSKFLSDTILDSTTVGNIWFVSETSSDDDASASIVLEEGATAEAIQWLKLRSGGHKGP